MSDRRENVMKPFVEQAADRISMQRIQLSKDGAREFTIKI